MSATAPGQAELDIANARFWNHICGSSLLKHERRPNMQRYDSAYLRLYPWLEKMVLDFIGPGAQKQKILEVGPGYGTVGRIVRAAWADYWAIDIAPAVITHTLAHTGGNAIVGSVLELDSHFPAESFDKVIAIGSLHHTGDMTLALRQIRRVLVPDGRLLAMIYANGGTHDFDPTTGEEAPWTDITAPDQIPSLFGMFTGIEITLEQPHEHIDAYIEAVR